MANQNTVSGNTWHRSGNGQVNLLKGMGKLNVRVCVREKNRENWSTWENDSSTVLWVIRWGYYKPPLPSVHPFKFLQSPLSPSENYWPQWPAVCRVFTIAKGFQVCSSPQQPYFPNQLHLNQWIMFSFFSAGICLFDSSWHCLPL